MIRKNSYFFSAFLLFLSIICLFLPMKVEAATFQGFMSVKELFPDQALQSDIRRRLNVPTVNSLITQRDLDNKIQGFFVLNDSNVANLEGMQYVNNLNLISFQNNNITNIAPLSQADLSKVNRIYLKDNAITSLAPFATANLMNLNELYVENNRLLNLNGLQEMKNLKTISFQSQNKQQNQVTSLAPLSGLINLEIIYAANNNITSLTPLANLTRLQQLYAESNQLTSLDGIGNKPVLNTLSVMNQNITDLSPLITSPNIVTLYIRSNNISDVTPLRFLTKLKKLYMEYNHVSDISSLSNLSLTEFYGSGQTVTLPQVTYSEFVPLKVTNKVSGRNNALISPSNISNGGTYTSPVITWNNLPSGLNQVTYNWSTTVPTPGTFSGTVTQPLVELPVISFKITNKMYNSPNPNQKTNYRIKLVTAEGIPILPGLNGLPSVSGDITTGTFDLGPGESITVRGLVGTTYTIVENIDLTQYDATYDTLHDTGVMKNQTLPANKTITGTLKTNPNQVDFNNWYKTNFTIENKFLPGTPINSAIYDIVFNYPDGSNSGDLYKNKTITSGQPFIEKFKVGTTYVITQRGVPKYEPSVIITNNGNAQPVIYSEVGQNLVVTGSIGQNTNKASFTNVKSEKLEITNKDISRYPNVSLEFNYNLTLSKDSGTTGKKYKATKYQGNTPIGTLEFTSGMTTPFTLKSGERLIFENLPIDIKFTINQSGVSSYTTTAVVNPTTDITVSGGGIGKGLTVSGHMVVTGDKVDFINKSDYVPPVTGVSDSFPTELVSLILVGMVIFSGIFAWRRYKLNK